MHVQKEETVLLHREREEDAGCLGTSPSLLLSSLLPLEGFILRLVERLD